VKRWAALLACCALPARAYVRSVNQNNLCLWWGSHGHSYQIDGQGTPDISGQGAFDSIRKSLQTWSTVSCSDLAFPEEPVSTDPAARVVGYFQNAANHNLILFRIRACRDVVPAGDSCLTQGGCANAHDCWDATHGGDGVIATTTTTSSRETGQIVDSDIELNDAPAANGSKFVFTAVDGLPCDQTNPAQTGCVRMDVQNTVTHEAGHTLGLDHSLDPNATMYASAPFGETSKRDLGNDDIQGVCAIYPRGQQSVTCAPQQNPGGGCGCSASQTGPGAALGVLLLLLQMRRRSRSKPQTAISPSTKPASAARSQSASED
jgi:MYXO-CTERM domain-containing protein